MSIPTNPGEIGPHADSKDFIEWLTEPAKDDPAEEVSEWVQFMACPNCKAQYPVFHSPAGSVHTLCDDCGWSSEDQS